MGRHSVSDSWTDFAMPSGHSYDAVWQCTDDDGWFQTLGQQLAAWLRSDGWDVDADQDGFFVRNNQALRIRRHQRDGEIFRLQLETTEGRLATRIEVVARDRPGAGDWLSVEISNNSGEFVEVPPIAKYLMDCLSLSHGTMPVADRPRLVTYTQYEDLLEWFTSDERRIPIAVAVALDHPVFDVNAFVADVGTWTGQVKGLVETFVLTGTMASQFEIDVPGFAPPAGALRVYAPGSVIGTEADAAAGVEFSFQKLATDSPAEISRELAVATRSLTRTTEFASDIASVRRIFNRLDDNRPLDVVQLEA